MVDISECNKVVRQKMLAVITRTLTTVNIFDRELFGNT